MFLECIIVCVDYDDFLDITLEYNKKHFDKIIVVTIDKDIKTKDICRKHNVEYTITNRLYENGDKFNKGKAINDGLKKLSLKDWVLITDADMVMNKNFRKIIEKKKLNKQCIYGTTRHMCPNYNEWLRYLDDEDTLNKWSHQRHKKAVGVGFFQLVNGNCTLLNKNNKWYSEDYGHAGRSDRMFWRKWPEIMRGKIRKASCIHLGYDEMSTNWYGRVTKKFSE